MTLICMNQIEGKFNFGQKIFNYGYTSTSAIFKSKDGEVLTVPKRFLIEEFIYRNWDQNTRDNRSALALVLNQDFKKGDMISRKQLINLIDSVLSLDKARLNTVTNLIINKLRSAKITRSILDGKLGNYEVLKDFRDLNWNITTTIVLKEELKNEQRNI